LRNIQPKITALNGKHAGIGGNANRFLNYSELPIYSSGVAVAVAVS
jgi:hypothetical protein